MCWIDLTIQVVEQKAIMEIRFFNVSLPYKVDTKITASCLQDFFCHFITLLTYCVLHHFGAAWQYHKRTEDRVPSLYFYLFFSLFSSGSTCVLFINSAISAALLCSPYDALSVRLFYVSFCSILNCLLGFVNKSF